MTMVLLLTVGTAGCGGQPDGSVPGSQSGHDPSSSNRASAPPSAGAESVRVFAVGDLGNKGDRDDTIARLIADYAPDAFFALGDTVYPNASQDNYDAFYDESYGILNQIVWPVPGNHDYRKGSIDDYLAYFDEHAPHFPGTTYYASDLGSWRIYALDSEIGESAPGDAMYDWLEADLTDHPSACIAAMWHKPIYTIGSKAYDEGAMRPIYDLLLAKGVDLVLTGHDHNYQRWEVDGITYFVVGTGGKSRYRLHPPADGFAYGSDQVNGALELELGPSGGSYVFHTLDDAQLDPGTFTC